MKDLYVAGMWILIMLIPYSPSWANIFSNPETSSREVSGDNSTPVVQCTGDITLSSQAEVDAFPATYGCTEITGTLVVSGDDITNIDSLYTLTTVANFLIRDNDSLTNLDGLSGLTVVGGGPRNDAGPAGLFISRNPTLTNIDGLASLWRVDYDLVISSNPKLADINGLSGLTSPRGLLQIDGNAVLAGLDGLSSLDSIPGSLFISNNPALANVDGLAAVKYVGGNLFISNNQNLPELDGLSSLAYVGGKQRIKTAKPGKFRDTRNCGTIIISENGADVTEEKIIAGGPCEETSGCPPGQLPRDKYVFAENESGYAPHATNIIVRDYEPGIVYVLRKNEDNSHVASPQPGSSGLYVHGVTNTTLYNVLARNPETGCEREMSTKVTVTIAEDHMAAARIALQKDINKEGTNRNVTLYPNPGNGEFDIEVRDDHSGLYYLYVRDLSGRVLNERTLLKEGKTLKAHIDLKPVTGGATYMLSIYRSGGQVAHKKLIIAGN